MTDRVFGRLIGVAGDLYLKHMNLTEWQIESLVDLWVLQVIYT